MPVRGLSRSRALAAGFDIIGDRLIIGEACKA